MRQRRAPSLSGRRVLITGAARGIGAALARRLHERGARVVLAGLEPELLAEVAADCGDAPFRPVDVTARADLAEAVADLAGPLGGLDVVVANAGIARQWPVAEGDPEILTKTLEVNVLGTVHTLQAALPHLSHPRGYALLVSSLSAAVHAPLLGAYSASKAAVEALGNTLRIELASTGARVGVAYFAELDTDMTRRGFGTEAASLLRTPTSVLAGVTPLPVAIDALEHGIAWRSRTICSPRWVAPLLPLRTLAQHLLETTLPPTIPNAVALATTEPAPFTTPQPPTP
ncbi:SDR family NAD(P)-dependent oxidoreductase [Actinocorallia sp. A-T 12471]|uniref:SDR family NAD(P)-dependent oxidoreductase n=1 Tax=Actinocorallia sp. A-T 12471 TaxID=3089813 RepID=UPI0029D1D1FB|nr:SDR family NAD(P)-dependent oxidoreductase [Actinocorallia sp. A-T 12471]MDX6739220.1 SDR family NAD(P)-dependent oxidoreductase [Actinocorallia sp. A-T 12471]